MIDTTIQVLGALIVLAGTVVRVTPDVGRWYRRRLLKLYPITRKILETRENMKQAGQGAHGPPIENRRVITEFKDYVDRNDIKEPPTKPISAIQGDGACIRVDYEDGDSEDFLRGSLPGFTVVKILSLAIERRCRNTGLLIAFFGTCTVVLGIVI